MELGKSPRKAQVTGVSFVASVLNGEEERPFLQVEKALGGSLCCAGLEQGTLTPVSLNFTTLCRPPTELSLRPESGDE